MAKLTVTFKRRDGTIIEHPWPQLPVGPPQKDTKDLMTPTPAPRGQYPPNKVDTQVYRKKGR